MVRGYCNMRGEILDNQHTNIPDLFTRVLCRIVTELPQFINAFVIRIHGTAAKTQFYWLKSVIRTHRMPIDIGTLVLVF